jgi:hypothetical protein
MSRLKLFIGLKMAPFIGAIRAGPPKGNPNRFEFEFEFAFDF